MAVLQPFNPAYGSGSVVSPGAASASMSIPANSKSVCLTNLGINICYVRIGSGTVTATTADYPVPPGTQTIVTKGESSDTLAHISATGTSLHVMVGEGW